MIREAILRWARNREPDLIIGGDAAYLRRFWLLPRNRFFNVYVHEFLRSDHDFAHHDRPYLFNASWIIDGTYIERMMRAGGVEVEDVRVAGQLKLRWGASPHRIELFGNSDGTRKACWTVFVTGPRVREWGFHCPHGWRHWREFTDPKDYGAVGKGCDA